MPPRDDLVGLGTQRHIGHHGVIGLVGVGEERDLLPRHDRIVQVDAGNTRGDQLRRLDTAVRVYRRAADLARLALDDLTAFERLAVGVEEASREVVRHAQLGRFAVEDHFRVGRQSSVPAKTCNVTFSPMIFTTCASLPPTVASSSLPTPRARRVTVALVMLSDFGYIF